jgi:dihydropteroate synthase
LITRQEFLKAGSYRLSLERPLVMGIVNVTPDSFSDGGRFFGIGKAIDHAWTLINEGADILDIGGESSRPGADPVSVEEEIARTIPVIEAMQAAGVPISIDTTKPEVMHAAVTAGASMINDINALRGDGAMQLIVDTDVAVCIMHMQGNPGSMQQAPTYENVLEEVRDYLSGRIEAVLAAGVSRERLVIDPGFGFGKTVQHNLALLAGLQSLCGLGCAVLAGISRKSTLGIITGRPISERVHASVAAALIAIQRGASLVRVHDVAATRDAIAILQAVEGQSGGPA